jgi:HD-GYP domain-containing protein (c-di-GMP phosphodiesterase class II)
MGGILHDIGKIGVPDRILMKRGKLNSEERSMMQRHPEIGARIIMEIDFLRSVVPFILYHHEQWDGEGYPYGLKGEEIPMEGRLLAVCDTFDAMTTARPYRKALEPKAAIYELRENMSSQFDPKVVEAFVSAWESGTIAELLEDDRELPTTA